MKRALVVVTKRPEAGQTKTRLTPVLSPTEAAELYRCLLLDTLDLMTQVPDVQLVISYAPEDARAYFGEIAPPGSRLVPQRGDNLGERLDHVLRSHLLDGYDEAVVMNSDGPTLPPSLLGQAFETLDAPGVDVVLGPSEDGGYYLIGLKRPCRALFDVTMSTDTVLDETLSLADEAGLTVRCLAPWYDVDRWEDVVRLSRELAGLPETVAAHTRAFLAELAPARRLMASKD